MKKSQYKKVLSSKNVRIALSQLIDRPKINKILFNYRMSYLKSFFGNDSEFAFNNPYIPYDPLAAIKNLHKSKIYIDFKKKSIPNIKFSLSIPDNKITKEIAKIIKNTYKDNGIFIKIIALPFEQYLKKLNSKSFEAILLSLNTPNEYNPISAFKYFINFYSLNLDYKDILFKKFDNFNDKNKIMAQANFFKYLLNIPKNVILNSFNENFKIRKKALRQIDKILYNEYFATLLFQLDIVYKIEKKR